MIAEYNAGFDGHEVTQDAPLTAEQVEWADALHVSIDVSKAGVLASVQIPDFVEAMLQLLHYEGKTAELLADFHRDTLHGFSTTDPRNPETMLVQGLRDYATVVEGAELAAEKGNFSILKQVGSAYGRQQLRLSQIQSETPAGLLQEALGSHIIEQIQAVPDIGPKIPRDPYMDNLAERTL